jgi:hypothetical protein
VATRGIRRFVLRRAGVEAQASDTTIPMTVVFRIQLIPAIYQATASAMHTYVGIAMTVLGLPVAATRGVPM